MDVALGLLGPSGDGAKGDDKEREGVLVVGVVEGWSGDCAADKNGASTEGELSVGGGSAAEESLGEGVGVPDLDGSFTIASKGFVFTCDDGNMVGGSGERERGGWGGNGVGGEGRGGRENHQRPRSRKEGRGEGAGKTASEVTPNRQATTTPGARLVQVLTGTVLDLTPSMLQAPSFFFSSPQPTHTPRHRPVHSSDYFPFW